MSLAEVQNKTVTWDKLQELCAAKIKAKEAFHEHDAPVDMTMDEQIRFDLEEQALLKATREADDAYHAALRRYQEQTK